MSIDFDRVEQIVTDVMRNIAFCSVREYTDGNEDVVENAVDNAFMALSYALPDVNCIDDTVTRRCAKSAIYEALDVVVKFRADNPGVAFHQLLNDNLDVEAVMEDIINMHSSDEDDYELEEAA